jgi:hypothetical protein
MEFSKKKKMVGGGGGGVGVMIWKISTPPKRKEKKNKQTIVLNRWVVEKSKHQHDNTWQNQGHTLTWTNLV